MSTAEDIVESSVFAKTAGELLKEYTGKISAAMKTMRDLQAACNRDTAESQSDEVRSANVSLYRNLLWAEADAAFGIRSSLKRAAQRVSQFLEHGVPTDHERLELELRLAEFEQSMRHIEIHAASLRDWASKL